MPMDAAQGDAAIPLYVDLDHTLYATDVFQESLVREGLLRPWRLPILIAGLGRRRPALKADLARRHPVDPEGLPWHAEVVDLVKSERSRGRQVILATAADEAIARSVAEHLGGVDGVIASDGVTNRKGLLKLAAIRADATTRGDGRFAYIGDHPRADPPIWAASAEAWVVRPTGGTLAAARRAKASVQVLGTAQARGLAVLRALRPHQWVKNLLLFVPALLAHRVTEGTVLGQVILAAVAFSLLASAVYVINDLLDVPADRRHRSKRSRPFAAGLLPVAAGPPLILLLFVITAGLAWLLPVSFVVWMGVYALITTAYSWRLKQVAVVDVLTLAGLYALRLLAGAAAADVVVSQWLLGLSMFLFTSLALCKRYTELAPLLEHHGDEARARGYRASDLPVIESAGVACGVVSVLVLALFIQSADVDRLYQAPWALWLICPLLLFWLIRIWIVAARGDMHDDPVVYALRDRVSLLTGALVAILALVAATDPFPGLVRLLVPGHGG